MSRKTELFLTLCGDIVLLSAAFFISWKAAAIFVPITSWKAITGNFILVLFWLFMFQSSDLYISRIAVQLMDDIFRLLKTLFFGFIIFIALAFVVNIDFIKAPGFIPSYIITLSSLVIWRLFWRGMIGENIRPHPKKVLIFQNGDTDVHYSQFNVVKKIKLQDLEQTIPQDIFSNNNIDGIVIESNGKRKEQVLNIISQFTQDKYEIFVSPKLYPLVYQYFLIQKIPDSILLKIIFHPLSTWDRFLKRTMDIVLSSLALVILSPILLVITLFIKIDTQGPVLYKQKRVGFRGRKFTLYKFRSMISDAEKHTGPVWAAQNDKRITRVGRILRPLRLDEWPQLINVVKGDMSFIGPRPERSHFVERLKKEIPLYSLRLNVHPGVTGLAQVRHNYDRSIEDVKKKLEYDLEYVNKISLRLDTKIFLKTILTVLHKQGAH
jgi:exopolysaccharide biosynthesis polyprenyl glycosylphosphotransferase